MQGGVVVVGEMVMGVDEREEKRDEVEDGAWVAARVRVEPAYMDAIMDDSWSQSIGESWMMQSESIQRYWWPSLAVREIASRKRGGRLLSGMLCK